MPETWPTVGSIVTEWAKGIENADWSKKGVKRTVVDSSNSQCKRRELSGYEGVTVAIYEVFEKKAACGV